MTTETETPTEWPEVWRVANIADISRDNDAARDFLNRLACDVVERYEYSPESLAGDAWSDTAHEICNLAAGDQLPYNGDIVETWSGLRAWQYLEEANELGGYNPENDTLDRMRVDLYTVANTFLTVWHAEASELTPAGARHFPIDSCDGRPVAAYAKCAECGVNLCACEESYGHDCEL